MVNVFNIPLPLPPQKKNAEGNSIHAHLELRQVFRGVDQWPLLRKATESLHVLARVYR